MADDDFSKSLKTRREISITVTGRRTGRAITIPVWFVYGDGTLWLLPVNGSETEWYRNIMADRAIAIEAGEFSRNFRATLVTDTPVVSNVIQQFREKYGPEDIKRWYTHLDVAVEIPIEAA
jgi:hypothetical protein